MRLNRYMAIFGTVICISILQTNCASTNLSAVQMPTATAAVDAQSPNCDDPLNYYSGLAVQANNEPSTVETNTLPVENGTGVCLKLREAIRLSMPGSKQQNDKKAVALLKELKRTDVLSSGNRQFINMLLQHVSQRQNLRIKIDAQEQRLTNTETQNAVLRNQLETLQSQLDLLKNIEVEIDKKERSVTSPINE